MAEFPDLGAHCTVGECRMLDFLPMKCDACSAVLCRDHIQYDKHSCPSAHKKNSQVPLCPLCSRPVAVPRHELPDRVIGEHIDRDCQSDPAQRMRQKALQCSLSACRRRELVEINCSGCKRHFCLNHRYPPDHSCTGTRKSNPRLRQMASHSTLQQETPRTEDDEALARALYASINFGGGDPEEVSRKLALQLQEEEYRRVNGRLPQGPAGTSSQRCSLS